MSGYTPEKMVFLDESGVNTNMARRYAYAVGGIRAVDAVPLTKPQNTTIDKFKAYLKDVLIPTLDSDSLVVMDNMRSHHTKAVTALLDAAGIHYLYLPPYSPDMNPIEKMWSKIKALLRKARVRALQDLPGAIEEAFQKISPGDCQGWFLFCGYLR